MNARGKILLVVASLLWLASAGYVAAAADTVHLTDEPGNWFRSDARGTPVSIINAGETVDFKIERCCTDTRHTVTLLVKPEGSTATNSPARHYRVRRIL